MNIIKDNAIKEVHFLDAGYCTHPECITIRGGRFKNVRYPSMFMLLKHSSHGHILYDTGYGSHFYEATKTFPEILYAKTTPVNANEKDFAKNKIKNFGIEAKDINYIIISHFHADHIGGVKDFPNAKFIYLDDDYKSLIGLSRFMGVKNAFLPALLPKDFENRSIKVNLNYKFETKNLITDYFDYSFDIFGDGSLVAVDLPGHTRHQMGLYFKTSVQEYFLVADSCWHSRSLRENILPSRITGLIHHDFKTFKKTLGKLHHIYSSHPEVLLAPSHCGEIFKDKVQFSTFHENLNGVYDEI